MTTEDRPLCVFLGAVGVASDSTRRLRHPSDRLAAQLARLSLAHKIARHVRGQLEDNRTTAIGAGKSFALLQQVAALVGVDELASYLGPTALHLGLTAPPPDDFDSLSAWPLPDTGLHAWDTGVLSKFGLTDWPTAESGASASAEPVLRFRPVGAARLPLRDACIALLKYVAVLFADIAVAAIRQIDAAQSVISTELARRVAVLAGNPGLRAFMLIILAVCRRYGRRSELDDHSVLPMRHYPTSWGVAACA